MRAVPPLLDVVATAETAGIDMIVSALAIFSANNLSEQTDPGGCLQSSIPP
jgi:hypothetical protein